MREACPLAGGTSRALSDLAMISRRTLLTALSLSLGCAANLPRAPQRPEAADALFSSPERADPAGLDDDPPEPFALRPGDVLRLRAVSLDPLEVDRVEVDEAGWVNVPLAGAVAVGGLRLDVASQAIENSLRPYDRFARVVVTVAEANGHRVTVVGAVSHPGAFPLTPDARVADVIALAGGPRSDTADGEISDLADLGGARVIRAGEALPVSVSLAMEGVVRHNVRVRAGDLVTVPPSRGRRVVVLGRVRSPKVLTWRDGLRLSEALAIAGGATDDGDDGDVRVVRGSLSAPRVYRASLTDLVNGRATDVALAPGDVVYVTEHWFAGAMQIVQRLSPLLAAGAVGVALVR
jgi:polysaccharide biosynthesis/export protein